jgi:hypothetical protein
VCRWTRPHRFSIWTVHACILTFTNGHRTPFQFKKMSAAKRNHLKKHVLHLNTCHMVCPISENYHEQNAGNVGMMELTHKWYTAWPICTLSESTKPWRVAFGGHLLASSTNSTCMWQCCEARDVWTWGSSDILTLTYSWRIPIKTWWTATRGWKHWTHSQRSGMQTGSCNMIEGKYAWPDDESNRIL